MSLAFLVHIVASGCTASADKPTQVTRVDSAGVEIVVSPEDGIGLPWVVEQEPAVTIGEGTDDPRYQFQSAFPARDERGRIAVTDLLARRVAIYDSVGSYLAEIGRAGQGPAEYTSPAQVFFSGDTVFVAKLSRKISAFDVDGTFLDSWQACVPGELSPCPAAPWVLIPPEGRVRGPGAPAGSLARLADGSFVLAGVGSIDPAREGIRFAQVPLGR